jgi:hypothetical protein
VTRSQEERVTTSLLVPPSDESAGVNSQRSNTLGPSYALNRQFRGQPRGRGKSKGKQPVIAQRQAQADQRDFEDLSQLYGII